MKHFMMSEPVILAYPGADERFISYVLGLKMEKGRHHATAYGVHALTKEGKEYKFTDEECLAVVEGVRHYRVYLQDAKPFSIYTRHKAIENLHKMKATSSVLSQSSHERNPLKASRSSATVQPVRRHGHRFDSG